MTTTSSNNSKQDGQGERKKGKKEIGKTRQEW